MTFENKFDGSQSLIILLTVKPEAVSAWQLVHGANKAEKDMNCPNQESCNRYRVFNTTKVGITAGKRKELEERSSILISLSTLSPYSLKL